MSAKLTALFAFAFGAIIGLAVGCQKYDFEPVRPTALSQVTVSKTVIAKKFKPNVMLMVDNSGSMYLPTNTALAACRFSDGGLCGTDYTDPTTYCNVDGGCPTRTSELRKAMVDFFSTSGTVARFGLATFPNPAPPTTDECGTGKVRVDISQSNDIDSELQFNADTISSTIKNDTIGGGTPTGDTLKMLGNWPTLQPVSDRDNFILLETDGVPNCNANNVNSGCQNPAACACTISTCCGGPSFPYERKGCLDQTETVSTINNLRTTKNLRTIVIGFGDETAGSAGTLNAMAEAGGFALACPDGGDGPCGTNNTCNRPSGKCVREYYQAANSQELAQALRDVINRLPIDPCVNQLTEAPTDLSLLAVLIDGQRVRSGPDTWTYSPGPPPTVTFVGSLCNRVRNATPNTPVQIDIRAVQTL